MDDKSNLEKREDSRINVNESYELQYGSEKFNVSKEATGLKQARELLKNHKNIKL